MRRSPWIMRGLLAVAVAVVVVGVIGVRMSVRADGNGSDVRASSMPRSEGIEAEYGIRIERVSLIGDDGIVELRYVLLDADAAGVLHADDQDFTVDFPHILAGDTVIDAPTFHHHGGDLVTGRELSILYGNLNGSIERGGTVSIEIGGERLDDVPVG